MPGNEAEDRIRNLFELGNSSQGQHLSHAGDGSWLVLNDNQWARNQRLSVAPLNFNLKNNSVQQSDSLGGQRLENNRSHPNNYQLNTNESLLGNQSFQTRQNQPGFLGEYTGYNPHNSTLRGLSILKSQQEYESGTDSPTLTANSERSEITEVSTDFNFLKGQQQLARGHQPGTPQPHSMQQSGYNDMQLLQQQMIFKQLQEFQRQQQFQQLGEARQQNPLNQLSAMSKQAAGGQFSPLNGTPINDTSQMFMNWVQSGASSAQGVSNRLVFSSEQGQPLRSMGLVSQPLDMSLYGTPVATSRGNMGQYSHVQGIHQAQKPVVQSSGFSNPLLRDQFTVSPNQVSMPQGALVPSQGFQGRNMFGVVPNQGLNSGILSGNPQEGNSPQTSSVKEFNGRQEQTGWPVMQQKATQHGSSQGLVPLDPMEEKILYNMDDTVWDASFGRRSDMGAVGFGNTLENTDLSNSVPSLQSGSWSALMQSAVAEASSSDTGMQEEWSGLTFQNTEQSTDNQLSNLMENDNQQPGWVDNNLQSASSFSSKPLHMFNDSSMSSSFPGFQQPGIRFSAEQREGSHQDGSHESMEKSPKVAGEWIDCNPQQKPPPEGSQHTQSFMHLNNTWAGQMHERSEGDAHQQRIASHRENSQINFSAAPNAVKTHATSHENNHFDYTGQADISNVYKEKESMGKSPQQISNGSHVFNNSYKGEGEAYEKQKSYYQRENSNGSYNSKELSGREQGHSGQIQFFGDASSNAMNLEQGHLPQYHGNSTTSDEVRSRGELQSVGSDGSGVAARASQNMLELLHKVDQSNDGTTTHFGSADCNSLGKVPEANTHTSGAQLHNQCSASQGFGLRLAPPSQRQPNSSHFLFSHGSPQAISYINTRQGNSELRDTNQTLVASPSSVQNLPPSHELSEKAHWDDKASAPGQTGTSSYLNMQGSSGATFTPAAPYVRNQPQMHSMSSPSVASQSSQPTLPSTSSRYPIFNFAASQDTSRQIFTNPLGQQFPVMESVLVSHPSVMSGISQQGEVSVRPHNVWTNVPIQRQPSVPEPLKVPSNLPSSMDPTNNTMINPPQRGYGSSEFGAGSQQQLISSERLDASQTAGLSHGTKPSSMHISDANARPSGSLLTHSHQQDIDGIRNDDNHGPAAAEANLVSVGHSMESSPNLHQTDYSLLNQVQAMTNLETEPSRRATEQSNERNSRFGNPMDSGQNSGVQCNPFPFRDIKMTSFVTEATEDPSAKALSQSALQDRLSNEMVNSQNNPQIQSGKSNAVSNLTEHSQVNLHMAPMWFKQYGTLKNGQMLPMYDARLAKMGTGQLSFGMPSQNLHMHASVEGVGACDASQGGGVMPSTVVSLVGTDHSSAPSVLPPGVTNQSMAIMRPKKRKIATPVILPWHKEVTQGSRLQNMSMAEQDWAQATNRVVEKVKDEMFEDVQPMLRSKRRLILTTQLMQQLLRPAPGPILSAEIDSHYESVTYFVSRLALGDACSVTYCLGNDMAVPTENTDMISEELKTSEGAGERQISVVEELIARAKKLENDFTSVEKGATTADIRVECQELERFGVINRFAKFHIRGGQADTSNTAKPVPHRYITAHAMPRTVPEGLQCISL